MFFTTNAISTYQRVGVETGVESADAHKLILMLFEGTQEALAKTRMHMQRNEIAEKGQMISKAITIIDEGLSACLDMKAGGDLAIKLQALYNYMTHRLLVANIQNNIEILDEVNKLLSELYTAWKEIGESNEAKIIVKAIAL
ncbi:flagellar export chaperone FliS [Nitrosomonas ureae]|jgi:flagellar secretion chaperone FliS|uniref:Flagellar secretion chaperone FliS n=1 Tax=Nitrosomonas ureae TaxID=44577 RepID=A0A0S3AJZ3_9PROT|nr:flagellar export chaperone FliS [Nitrosomonas ureae]ALQ51438.1 flagellar protein FliS [Nitrosomonas ureae]PTQ79331.1 flagellar protein FliS [Nitrosomonas ureae]PXX08571.1 flagellar protein FliS [Nitrosomonas ureae]SDU12812.1 flagellar protein FliS [Nitrosomonas ureae]SEQ05391.1 flagellar protein FliS [Nitrosomonas ureae]